MSKPTNGSVFILVLGLMVIATALSYALVVTMRTRQQGGLSNGLNQLARQAALAGSTHAIEVIDRSFLSNGPRPGSLGSDWRAAFAPIDSGLAGKEGVNVHQDRPQGIEYSPYDENENDIKAESLLTDSYFYLGSSENDWRDSTGYHRNKPFVTGSTWLSGTARWIEPGNYHRDLIGKPISFHLEHPCAANPSSPDPARRLGEPWVPDLNEPIWYDSRLVPTTDLARVRYRLRYAVEIESLDGKILSSCQAPYQAPGSGVPTQISAAAAAEVDRSVTARYADAYANMVMQLKCMARDSNMDGMSDLAGKLSWRAHGLYTRGGNDGKGAKSLMPVLSSFNGGKPQYWSDYDENVPVPTGERNLRLDQQTEYQRLSQYEAGRNRVSAGGKSVRYAFGDGQNHARDTWQEVPFAFTPFGRATTLKSNPQHWYEGYTDCPWRINLTTATARTISSMVFAYLPQEAHALRYDLRQEASWTGRNAQTGEDNYGGYVPTDALEQLLPKHIDLFTAPSPLAGPFAGTQPYPGTTSAWKSGDPVPDPNASNTYNAGGWNEFLGRANQANDWADKLNLSGLRGMAATPLQGAWLAHMIPWQRSSIEKDRTTGAGGKRVYLQAKHANMMSFAVPTWKGNYWYTDSYWLDLANALCMTVQLTQYAHQRLDGRQRIGDAAKGVPLWPSVPGDPEYNNVAGQPMLDVDLDGDGVEDSPSLLNTIPLVDRQFLKFLGENPDDPGSGAPNGETSFPTVFWGFTNPGWGQVPEPFEPDKSEPKRNRSIRNQLIVGKINPAQAALMELALNDLRLSFFGASPQYPNFAALDFDGNGSARCSGYAGGTGSGVVPIANRFSLTGYFVLQQSRFYRIVIRGEVFDVLRNVQAAETNLETVYVCDPTGLVYDVQGERIPTSTGFSTDLSSSRVLSQRWLWNKHRALRQRIYP